MNVLFVCTGNTCRSSMAEALFKDMLKEIGNKSDEIKVHSAGIFAIDNRNASPQAIIAMENKGIDLTKHKSSLLTIEMIEEADLILTMTTNHKNTIMQIAPKAEEKVYTLKEFAGLSKELVLDIADPYGQSVEKYIETAKEIREALEEILRKI